MTDKTRALLDLLTERYPQLTLCKDDILQAYKLVEKCYSGGGKLLIAGNGGSSADAEHIVGELMKGFQKPRKLPEDFAEKLAAINDELGRVLMEKLQGSLPAIALGSHNTLLTAYMNDCDPLLCFAQEVNGYGNENDVFWGISTSGNSQNILYASVIAKAKSMKVIGMTGANGGKLCSLSDVCIRVPETETHMVQELHLPVYHTICLMIEEENFGGK